MLIVMKVYTTYKHGTDWTINDLFLEMTHSLRDKYGANIYCNKDQRQNLEEFDYLLSDCEIAVYDENTDSLKAISYSETKTKLWDIFITRNNSKDILVVLHQDQWGFRSIDRDNLKFSLKRTTFYSYLPTLNMRYFYNKRRNLTYKEMDNKMFFRCTTGRGDEEALRKLCIITEQFNQLPMNEYLLKAIKYKVGLAISGVAELCHRDLDYMGIGLPLLRFEYVQDYNPDLIPNYHYISVDRENLPKDSNLDLHGGPEYVEKYIRRYKEVETDYKFLDFISKNAYNYYQENCTPENRVNLMLKKLEL